MRVESLERIGLASLQSLILVGLTLPAKCFGFITVI